MMCHGEDGRGNRPIGSRLRRPIPDLLGVLAARDDEALYRILAQGLVTHHAFGTELAADERWHLINYLRSINRNLSMY
ncbi:MAG: c-type cytochrome [Anaerolineales bacterium]